MTERSVREYDVFYESSGPFAVDPQLARRIADGALVLVSRYTGLLLVRSFNGLRISGTNSRFKPEDVKLGGGAHTILFTKREIDDPVASTATCDISLSKWAGRILNTATTVSIPQLESNYTLPISTGDTAHELAHGFGLSNKRHCRVMRCLMRAETYTYPGTEVVVASSDPFCRNCANDLRAAGAKELAHH